MLLYDLPQDRDYILIFMKRNLDEVIASQKVMLARKGETPRAEDEEMKRLFSKHLSEGYSVKEVINASSRITGIDIPYEYTKRREGDPAILVGSSKKIINELGWEPQYPQIAQIIETAWKWHREHPYGFRNNKVN